MDLARKPQGAASLGTALLCVCLEHLHPANCQGGSGGSLGRCEGEDVQTAGVRASGQSPHLHWVTCLDHSGKKFRLYLERGRSRTRDEMEW